MHKHPGPANLAGELEVLKSEGGAEVLHLDGRRQSLAERISHEACEELMVESTLVTCTQSQL